MELLTTLTQVIVDLGEVGVALMKVTLFVGRVLLFIMKLPWPLAVAVVICIMLLWRIIKSLALTYAGIWVCLYMTLDIVRKCGIAMAFIGLIFLCLDLWQWSKILPKSKAK